MSLSRPCAGDTSPAQEHRPTSQIPTPCALARITARGAGPTPPTLLLRSVNKCPHGARARARACEVESESPVDSQRAWHRESRGHCVRTERKEMERGGNGVEKNAPRTPADALSTTPPRPPPSPLPPLHWFSVPSSVHPPGEWRTRVAGSRLGWSRQGPSLPCSAGILGGVARARAAAFVRLNTPAVLAIALKLSCVTCPGVLRRNRPPWPRGAHPQSSRPPGPAGPGAARAAADLDHSQPPPAPRGRRRLATRRRLSFLPAARPSTSSPLPTSSLLPHPSTPASGSRTRSSSRTLTPAPAPAL
jgi:hypothetical protein